MLNFMPTVYILWPYILQNVLIRRFFFYIISDDSVPGTLQTPRGKKSLYIKSFISAG